MPGTLSWVCTTCRAQTGSFPTRANVVAGSVLVVLMNTRGPLATSLKNFEKQDLLLRSLKHAHPGTHTEVIGRMRESSPAVLPLWV